ncbi:MBL fold metallo-hydrolase [Candidatus Parcubacteria bacterium]|nr:MBL fold metallo-hydrolase [Candidatus Parcubacteria bacterium]
MAVNIRIFVLGALILLNLTVAVLMFYPKDELLVVSFLDVGQGDAIYIKSPTGTEVLVDGGRDRSVLRELQKHMGPLNRSLTLVVETHPDADHIGGFPAVLERYAVHTYVSSNIENDTNQARALAEALEEETNIKRRDARRGERMAIGGGAYIDILFPDRAASGIETNSGSVVMRLVYGDTSFLLTGDAPDDIEEWLVALDGEELKSDVLKAGHHGSRTSTSEHFLAYVLPEFVVVSAGKDNAYGHPHKDVTDRIQKAGAALLTTMGKGPVTFTSNGKTIAISQKDF